MRTGLVAGSGLSGLPLTHLKVTKAFVRCCELAMVFQSRLVIGLRGLKGRFEYADIVLLAIGFNANGVTIFCAFLHALVTTGGVRRSIFHVLAWPAWAQV